MAEQAPTDRRPKGRKDSRLTRALLVEAASRLFASRGFDGATVDEIARDAGVNKAMISYHFGGKERLYGAILEEALSTARAELQAIRFSDVSSSEKLARYVETFAKLQTDRPNLGPMLLRELLSGGRFIDRTNVASFLSLFESVRAIIAEGVARGEFRPVSPLLTHLSIVGSIVFFFATEPFRRRLIAEGRLPMEPPAPEEFVQHLKDLALRSLAPGKGDAP